MIKFRELVLFLLFVVSTFLLVVAVSDIIIDGFKKGKELFFQLGNVLLYTSYGFAFYNKLYKKKDS
jgi:hypothetical protein